MRVPIRRRAFMTVVLAVLTCTVFVRASGSQQIQAGRLCFGPVVFKANFAGTPSFALCSSPVPTVMPIENVVADTVGGYDALNHRYQPSVPGTYLITFQLGFEGITEDHRLELGIVKVGTSPENSNGNAVHEVLGGAGEHSVGVTTLVFLNGAGDYLEFRAQPTNLSGGTSCVTVQGDEAPSRSYVTALRVN